MDILTLIHQGVLFAHLVAFAIAFATVLREDLALFNARRIDVRALGATARTLTGALIVLWLSGLALVVFDLGPDPLLLLVSPKSAAKVAVVTALTANGVLRRPRPRSGGDAAVPVVLGAISTASWLCASFIGASRLIAPSMSFEDFMWLYGVLLIGAVACALVFVRPHVARLLVAAP
jgi:hypothetical protein